MDMKASVDRRQNAKHEPDVYGFEAGTLGGLREALGSVSGDAEAKLLVRLGRDEEANPEAFLQVKAGDGTEVGAFNVSFTCPPRPPEDCFQ